MNLSTNNASEINAIMVRYVPELASEYSKFPMHRERWPTANQRGDKGEKLYLQESNDGLKMDYVYGCGPYGKGYYSLLTKAAYTNLYNRVIQEMPMGCCIFNQKARKTYDEWDDVKRILYSRSVATVPDDGVAFRDAMAESQQTAQSWSLGMQGELLTHNFVNGMNPP